MGILLSIIQYLGSKSDVDDNNERPRANTHFTHSNCVESDYTRHQSDDTLGTSHQWRQMNYLTVSVPNLRLKPSLGQATVNDEVKDSSVVIEQKRQENVIGRPEKINCQVAPPLPEGRWIKHYSSCHQILLAGEGDFSFSTCLAKAFGWASNIVATSLDSQAFLVQNYGNAMPNLVELSIRRCKVMHEVDVTQMANNAFLGGIKFDRIVFNFPFAGFFKNLSRNSLLSRHRRLVSLFLKNAKEMISENGEIHISHKTNGFHIEWKIEAIANSHRLRLIDAVDFNVEDYPGYNTKRGFGGDRNFNCNPSKTYKFGLKS